jgi:phage shock protein C
MKRVLMTSFFANVRGGTLFLLMFINFINLFVYLPLIYLKSIKIRIMPNNLLQNWLKDMVERNAYGACRYLGDKMNVAPAEVRKYFIYTSFIGMGSPIIVYLVVAFWYNVRKYIRRGMSTIWE